MAKSPAWQRKEGKNPKGGLSAAYDMILIKNQGGL
jgi:hypothetical protein